MAKPRWDNGVNTFELIKYIIGTTLLNETKFSIDYILINSLYNF